MKTLLKNGTIVNVFTHSLEQANVLIEDAMIIGLGDYEDADADVVHDAAGKIICPGFIDSHIHIESTMMTPFHLAQACIPHGTTSIVADPHEIANVCGTKGIEYMIEASDKLPLTVYLTLPSCVPASPLDESGSVLFAKDLKPLYRHPRVIGLGEMMNYPGVLSGDPDVMQKIADAHEAGKVVNGHAPLLTGKALDRYIAAGIRDDHECSSPEEGKERIRKGQWVIIREGTAAHNLLDLLPLFDEPYARRCLLGTDDRHPADLLSEGHIDHMIRMSAAHGKPILTTIRMATLQAAEYFGLRHVGAVAPGYIADLLLLDDLNSVSISDVYCQGKLTVSGGKMNLIETPKVPQALNNAVRSSFSMPMLSEQDFLISPSDAPCRVIRLIPRQLLTQEWITALNFERGNGIDLSSDILKLAVIERHLNTGHMGLGFIHGFGLKRGAIASSVSHDSHNLIVIGANEADMAFAANRIHALGGGYVVVEDGVVLAQMPLPIAGLMSDCDAQEAARQNEAIRCAAHRLGIAKDFDPFMTMSFVSLPVIPELKMTTQGLVDVIQQKRVSLFIAQSDTQ